MGEFYKMEYDAWDEGTVELSLEEEAAYLRLCHQIYRRKGPVPNSIRLLCSIWRCHANRARRLLFRLVQSGKIIIDDNEQLTNERALAELKNRATKSRNTPRQTQQTPTQIPERSKDLSIYPLQPIENVDPENAEERREEKRRREKKERTPIGVSAAPAAPAAKRRKSNPMTTIPDDFQLTAPRIQIAADAGLDADATFREFREWAIDKSIKSAHWDVAWERSVRRQAQWARERPQGRGTAYAVHDDGVSPVRQEHDPYEG
jgi:uncharacterized protein YdaU (DUF1376 family)